MAGDQTDAGEGYSVLVGLVYLFNLIVGTGALTMPAAFSHSGWLLSLLILIAISFMSFLTVTFVIEAMAVANAMVHWRTVKHIKKVINEEDRQLYSINPSRQELVDGLMKDEIISNSIEHDEKVPLLLSNSMESVTDSSAVEYYNITESIELGKMASLFFNKIGVNLFYFCIAIYLYGDLSIYAAAVSKSLRDVTCNYVPGINGCNISYHNSDPCWSTTDAVSRKDAYRIYLCVFLCLLGPFVFFNVQKTKYLQMLTSFMRWLVKHDGQCNRLIYLRGLWFSTYSTILHFRSTINTPAISTLWYTLLLPENMAATLSSAHRKKHETKMPTRSATTLYIFTLG